MVGTHVNTKTKKINLQGKLRQRTKNRYYHYRLTVSNGIRKEFTLQTRDYDEAVKQASELDSIWLAPTKEVALAQMNALRGFSKPELDASFDEAWEIYRMHPDRAVPTTAEEQIGYQRTFQDFVEFATGITKKDVKHPATSIRAVKPELCEEYADDLRSRAISVDTHNRMLRRLRKVFSCLKEYYEGENPFRSKTLWRREREEQGKVVHRQAFTKEQEDRILAVLSDYDPKHKVRNKDEIRVIYTIGIYTGQRLKDCVLLQWQNIDMRNRRIWVKQFKTGKEVTIPIADKLYEALHEAELWRRNQYVTPHCAERYNRTDAQGVNVGNNLINLDVLRPIRWIGLEPSIKVPGRKRKMTIYGFHSVRHSFASFCAEAGVPKAVLLSILGTDSDIADKYYTHVSEESQRKAIEAISSRNRSTSQERIDRALKLLMPDGNQPEHASNGTIQQVLEILKGA